MNNKINLKERFKNPIFIINLLASIGFTIITYLDINYSDITTYAKLFAVTFDTFKNPYLLGLILVNIWGVIYNPATKGLGD